jgi:alginate O-acetyltransferase complex protein AlgI
MIWYSAFLLLMIAGCWVRGRRPRQLLLLAASYVFYAAWGTGILGVLVVSSLFNYFYGEFLRRDPTLKRLSVGVAANVLLLAFYKTIHFWAGVGTAESPASQFLSDIAIPIGVSFWTFQALSYLFDIYRQEEVDPSLLEFGIYMAFWPTVIMGPICRLSNMLPQFREANRPPSAPDFIVGIRRIAMGLCMKLVVSQTLVSGFSAGTGVNAAFNGDTASYGGLDVWFLAIGFGFQLFFDFAGYSHIVIGAARIFGFHLEENFNSPFLASSPSEFWTRWHMSLSSWIRDYVFMPFAGLRRDVWWRYATLVFSMTLFGLWHGVQSTFALWGIYQGTLLMLHRVIQQYRRNSTIQIPSFLENGVSWLVSFLAVSLGWIFFRAGDLDQALQMYWAVLSPSTYTQLALSGNYYLLVSVVAASYFGYRILDAGVLCRARLALTPQRTAFLAEFGITRGFVTILSLVPVLFLVFFSLLIAHSGSEGVSGFVYAVF